METVTPSSKDRISVNGHRQSLVGDRTALIPTRCLGVIDKPQVRTGVAVIAHHGILARSDIGRLIGVGMALRRLESGKYDRIVKSRGYLADTAARLLNHNTVRVGSRRLVAFFRGTVSSHLVKGEFLSRLNDRSVDRRAGKADILISVLVGRRLCRVGSDTA